MGYRLLLFLTVMQVVLTRRSTTVYGDPVDTQKRAEHKHGGGTYYRNTSGRFMANSDRQQQSIAMSSHSLQTVGVVVVRSCGDTDTDIWLHKP